MTLSHYCTSEGRRKRGQAQVLTAVTNPAEETHRMTYSTGDRPGSSDGLLREFTRPGGQTTSFSYDQDGRLVREEDAVGGFQEFEREVFDTGYTVTRTTAMGRQDSYNVSNLPTEDREMNNKGFDGLKRKKLRQINGQRRIRRPDNMEVNLQQLPDPRFGMMSPNQGSVNVQTPEGRSLDVSRSREVSTGNAVAVRSVSDTFRINGREWVRNFDGTTRRTTTISPEGRRQDVQLNDRARPSRIEQEGLLPIEHDYNENGQLVETTQGDRTTTRTYNADGFLSSVTDPVGRTTQFTYDPAGRVTSRTLPNGEQVEFQYDDNGNLTALTPPGRDAHVFRYTDREQMEDYEPPDLPSGSTITTWTYNLDRQLARIQRPDMSTVNFTYDDAGRRETLDYPTGQRTFNYSSSTGNLTGIQADAGVDLTFQYDGSLPTRTRWSGSQVSGRLDLTYDDNFRVTDVAINGSSAAARNYDQDGLLVRNGPLVLDRDPQHGLVQSLSVGASGPGVNPLTTSWTYNDFGEVIASSTEMADSEFYTSRMQRDLAGRIVTLSENLQGEPGQSRTYEYDDLGRLVGVDRGNGQTVAYNYDSNGNRLARTGAGVDQTDFSYDAQDRLLSYRKNGDTLVNFTYTANGELESRTIGTQPSTTYDYDALGNLRSVTLEGDTTIEYVIDGQDRRVGKRVDGQLVKGFLYKDKLNPIAQLDSDGSVEAVFLYGQKDNVPAFMSRRVDGQMRTYRIISNHLGSVRMVVDLGTGEVVQRMKYDAFGRVLKDSNPGFQPFGFAGGLYDHQTGLVRFGARDYDPRVGRWTSKDPLLFGGGTTNLYGYVVGDPINGQDPFGLFKVDLKIGGTLAIAGEDRTLLTFDSAKFNYSKGEWGFSSPFTGEGSFTSPQIGAGFKLCFGEGSEGSGTNSGKNTKSYDGGSSYSGSTNSCPVGNGNNVPASSEPALQEQPMNVDVGLSRHLGVSFPSTLDSFCLNAGIGKGLTDPVNASFPTSSSIVEDIYNKWL